VKLARQFPCHRDERDGLGSVFQAAPHREKGS
jgi:hypothetical protein